MKLHYGYLVTGAMLFFVGFMGYIVYGSMSENIDLVADNYYEKELNFQQEIDSEKNANQLSELVKFYKDGKEITILLPKEFAATAVKGDVYFRRNSDKTLDVNIDLNQQKTIIPLGQFQTGPYHLEVHWEAEGTSYFFKDYIVF